MKLISVFFLFFKLGTYGSLFMPKRSERTFIFHNKVSKDHANTLNTQLIGLGYKFYIDLYIYIISYIFLKEWDSIPKCRFFFVFLQSTK